MSSYGCLRVNFTVRTINSHERGCDGCSLERLVAEMDMRFCLTLHSLIWSTDRGTNNEILNCCRCGDTAIINLHKHLWCGFGFYREFRRGNGFRFDLSDFQFK